MTTITVQIPLRQPSNRKEKRLQETMDRQHEIAQRISGLMPSISSSRWSESKNDFVFHRWRMKYFPDANGLRCADANEVAWKVANTFSRWQKKGALGESPKIENKDWARFHSESIRYERNNGVWAVKIPLKPYAFGKKDDGHEWFQLRTGRYHEILLEKAEKLGAAEVKKYDFGYAVNQYIHLPDKIGEYTPETFVGVDVGLDNIATVAAVSDNGIQQIEIFSGNDVAHHRNRLRNLRSELQKAGKAEKVRELRGLIGRYCEQRNHEISRKIVDIASDHENPVIVLEDLRYIRNRLNEQRRSSELTATLNSWAFAELQGMVRYKAAKDGIQTMTVDSAYTSQNCNKCGEKGLRPYKGNPSLFYCENCDYEVNADVNAAINISRAATV